MVMECKVEEKTRQAMDNAVKQQTRQAVDNAVKQQMRQAVDNAVKQLRDHSRFTVQQLNVYFAQQTKFQLTHEGRKEGKTVGRHVHGRRVVPGLSSRI